jgi:peptidoglycan hydrolase CwlO-like protein
MDQISLDGKDYEVANLSEQAQYFVRQISDLQEQVNQHRFKMDQANLGMQAFIANLRNEIAQSEESFTDPTFEFEVEEGAE